MQQLKTLAASPSPTLDLVNPKKSGQKGYYHSGVLSVREATVNARPSFLQYITGKRKLQTWYLSLANHILTHHTAHLALLIDL